MTRVIAGRAKGRRLTVPKSGTRPTSDRVREALFSSVETWLAQHDRAWTNLVVADVFAGSGALGFEAWSRGAERVIAVESDARACRVLRANRDALGADAVDVISISAAQWLRAPSPERIDLCFLDPPYDMSDEAVAALTTALASVLAPLALVAVERRASAGNPFDAGWAGVWERRYGDTRIWYGPMESDG